MVDDIYGDSLTKYCKEKSISIKEYPKYLKEVKETTVVNPLINRRKKIPPKCNDNVVSDHETSTSCSEGEDDDTYIKSCKTNPQQLKAIDQMQKKDLNSSSTSITSTSTPTSITPTLTTKPNLQCSEILYPDYESD